PSPSKSFFIFRSEFVSETCNPSQSELSKVAGNVWRNMGEDQQQPFKVRAEEEKQEHYRKYPNYIYTP
ncbi:high mobility group box domain-containing protein, partial [Mycena crocata]